jgi:hypothetical protein
MAGISR